MLVDVIGVDILGVRRKIVLKTGCKGRRYGPKGAVTEGEGAN